MGYDCTCVIHGMRHATPCPTVFSAPDHRLKTTPTFPGWMIVNDAHAAARTKSTSPRTAPLASICGALPRKSSAIATSPSERAVPAPLEDHDARAPGAAPASERAGDARLEPATQRPERSVEEQYQRRQDEQLAGTDHRRRL